MVSFTLSIELRITPKAFWERMSISAVNKELLPLVFMTAPSRWKSCSLQQWATGRVLFRSVILLFGVVPIDVHSLKLEHIYPESGFLERSHSLFNKQWQHERTTAPTEAGCVVTDTVTVEGRVPLVAALLLPVYRLVFQHRHRRLRVLYGYAGGSQETPSK